MRIYKTQFDEDLLKQILDSFVELTDIRAAFFEDYVELVNGGDKNICGFCEIIRKEPAVLKACIACDIAAYQKAKESSKPYLYKCHIGLWEAVCPIPLRGSPNDYLMLGQVKCEEDKAKTWLMIEQKLPGYGMTKDQISSAEKAYDEMPCISHSRLLAAVKMLDLITRHIIGSGIISTKELVAVKKAKEYIDQNFQRPVSINELAEKVVLSPSYLSHLFSKETGMTITSYTDLQRIDHAKKLLIQTTLLIKEIAFQSGFSDQNYFSRIFKKYTGQSPAAFRDEIKK